MKGCFGVVPKPNERTDLVNVRIDEAGRCFKPFIINVGRLYRNIITGAKLNVGFFKVVSYSDVLSPFSFVLPSRWVERLLDMLEEGFNRTRRLQFPRLDFRLHCRSKLDVFASAQGIASALCLRRIRGLEWMPLWIVEDSMTVGSRIMKRPQP